MAGALGLVFAAILAGCASKNPLMDDTPVAAAPAKPAATASAPAAAQPAAPATAVTTQPTAMQRFVGFLRPYRVDIQQGNFVSREMVEQLRESMQRPEGVTREQVQFALGTPLMQDIFHADRWDYPFRLQKRNGEVLSSKVIVYFSNNRVTRIESGELPTEQEYLALIAGEGPAAQTASASPATGDAK